MVKQALTTIVLLSTLSGCDQPEDDGGFDCLNNATVVTEVDQEIDEVFFQYEMVADSGDYLMYEYVDYDATWIIHETEWDIDVNDFRFAITVEEQSDLPVDSYKIELATRQSALCFDTVPFIFDAEYKEMDEVSLETMQSNYLAVRISLKD